MTTYKIIKLSKPREMIPPEESEWRLDQARQLKSKYGLSDWSLEEIILRWENYSESMCAGWLSPDKESVEEVFGVVLEEIDAAE